MHDLKTIAFLNEKRAEEAKKAMRNTEALRKIAEAIEALKWIEVSVPSNDRLKDKAIRLLDEVYGGL